VTSVERRAVIDAATSAGARTVYLIDQPLAAAIGAKIPIAAPSGNMIVDIGGGSTEAAVISLGGVVVYNSVRVAGNKLDEAIASYIRHKYNLMVGENLVEEIKIKIGSALPLKKPLSMEVRGRDTLAGLPRTIEITSQEVTDAITHPLQAIAGAVKGVLENIPPEIASDIIDKGVVLSGGTSQLQLLDKLLTKATGVPCYVAQDPMLCVIRGTGVALDNIDLYKRSIQRQ